MKKEPEVEKKNKQTNKQTNKQRGRKTSRTGATNITAATQMLKNDKRENKNHSKTQNKAK